MFVIVLCVIVVIITILIQLFVFFYRCNFYFCCYYFHEFAQSMQSSLHPPPVSERVRETELPVIFKLSSSAVYKLALMSQDSRKWAAQSTHQQHLLQAAYVILIDMRWKCALTRHQNYQHDRIAFQKTCFGGDGGGGGGVRWSRYIFVVVAIAAVVVVVVVVMFFVICLSVRLSNRLNDCLLN